MKRAGLQRRKVIASLVPAGRAVIDVGADHGHVASMVGAIATERLPHRRGQVDVPWVVSDGLTAFRSVDVAIIAGMGAHLIHRILLAGPRPNVLVVHAPDDPPTLRRLVTSSGWRIEAEALAPEGGKFAEVLRLVPGQEPAKGLWLDYGPVLLRSDDPYLVPHLAHRIQALRTIVKAVGDRDPDRRDDHLQRATFLEQRRTAAIQRAAESTRHL